MEKRSMPTDPKFLGRLRETLTFLYSVILTEYVAMEPRVCVCMCVFLCVEVLHSKRMGGF